MRYWLVNESAPHYNLGLEKARNWLQRQGHTVTVAPFGMEAEHADVIWFSVIFSWHVPHVLEHAALAHQWGKPVEIGGPATAVNGPRIQAATGVIPHVGTDSRFETEAGDYLATFTSRGCIRSCPWCIVPKAEGAIREIPDFIPARMVHDNNFSATSEAHQIMAVERLATAFPKGVSFDQGWDVRVFDQWHLDLYRHMNPVRWRFAFDFMGAELDVVRVCKLFRKNGMLNRNKMMFLVLVGFGEGLEKDMYRARRIAELGASPFVMKYVPLDSMTKDCLARGWPDAREFTQFARYYNIPQVWTSHADITAWLKRIKPSREVANMWDLGM